MSLDYELEVKSNSTTFGHTRKGKNDCGAQETMCIQFILP